jgi:spore cortex protein
LQKKAIVTLSSAVLLAFGLSGCNPGTTKYNNNLSPVGYHSNENVRDGNRIVSHKDNDGPITEMMDRYGNNGFNNNNAIPLVNNNNNRGITNTHKDVRNNGHLNNMNNNANSFYYNTYDGRLAEHLASRAATVKNVNNARAAINGNDVLIAVDTTSTNQKRVADQVKKAVQPIARNKKVHVATDRTTFSKVKSFDNNLRNGKATSHIKADLTDLFQTVGNTITKPFR